MIGFIGAHRVGKTTLAKDLAKEFDLEFLETNVSGFLKEQGVDPKENLDFQARLKIQDSVLEFLAGQYAAATGIFIADRTPMDVAAYTLTDIQRATLGTIEERSVVERHFQRAVELTQLYFAQLIHVRPGIEIAETEGKAPSCLHYIRHFDYVAEGLVRALPHSIRVHGIAKHVIDHDRRIAICIRVIEDALDTIEAKASNTLH
ncbi:AAA family ATPase [Dyella telluris]|uniref:AAA family ATPase n=1 Tax=Dyella telluris TaxID=2763498 RepID=A0A7G8Q4M6_9GAMM|nr:AAA family ATPase [Dyella telluris]QNK01734.1 AAA family ATPase [Dyella telluris]